MASSSDSEDENELMFERAPAVKKPD